MSHLEVGRGQGWWDGQARNEISKKLPHPNGLESEVSWPSACTNHYFNFIYLIILSVDPKPL